MEVRKKPQFQISEIPSTINGVKLTDRDIEKLLYGEPSGLLKGLMFEEGEVRDGKIWLSRDETGQLEINYLFAKHEVPISKQIEDYVLPDDIRLKLLNNETVGPFLFGGQHVFLQVDQEINRVLIKSGYEINVPKKIASYSLTAEDMNTLANGGKLENRLFCINGKYYTAKIGMTKDKRGILFENLLDQSFLSNDELILLEKTLNKPSDPVPPLELSPGLEETRTTKKKEFAQYLSNPVEFKRLEKINQQPEIFRDAVDDYNVTMLVKLKEAGFVPGKADIDYIKYNVNIDNEEKRAIGTVFDIKISQPDQAKKAPDVSADNEPDKDNPQKSGESAVAQKFGNLLTEAFSNM